MELSAKILETLPDKGITIERIIAAVEADEYIGFCVFCGSESSSPVEPDARGYYCDCCGGNGIFGAEELLLHLA